MARIKNGFFSFFRGFQLIQKENLWKYILLPSLVSLFVGVLVFAGVYLGSYQLIENMSRWAMSKLGALLSFDTANWPGFLLTFFKFLLHLVAGLIAIIINIIVYRTLASIIVIPFMGPLLNQVELKKLGRSIGVSLSQDLRNAALGAGVGIQFALVGFIVLIVSLFLGPFQIFINGAVQSYFLGRSAFDYIIEKETDVRQQRRKLVRAYRLEILGLGFAFFLVMLIPLVGVFLAPACSIAGAALVFHPEDNSSEIL